MRSRHTQRWEHWTADLTLSTSVVTRVWYSIWALEASSFASEGQRKEQQTGKEGIRCCIERRVLGQLPQVAAFIRAPLGSGDGEGDCQAQT